MTVSQSHHHHHHQHTHKQASSQPSLDYNPQQDYPVPTHLSDPPSSVPTLTRVSVTPEDTCLVDNSIPYHQQPEPPLLPKTQVKRTEESLPLVSTATSDSNTVDCSVHDRHQLLLLTSTHNEEKAMNHVTYDNKIESDELMDTREGKDGRQFLL